MNKANSIRISKLIIENIKNVEHGEINFVVNQNENADIIGVYGQNGSGKTALVNSLEILQNIFCGQSITDIAIEQITKDKQSAKIVLEFNAYINDKIYEVEYAVVLSKNDDDVSYIDFESLKLGSKGLAVSKTAIFETRLKDEEDVFLPKNHFSNLSKNSRTAFSKLLAQKFRSRDNNMSLLFNEEFINTLKELEEDTLYIDLLELIQRFSRIDLFIVKNSGEGIMNVHSLLPIPFRLESKNENTRNILKGAAPMMLQPGAIPKNLYDIMQNIIEQLNIVLKRLVPNLKIGIKDLGRKLDDKGQELIIVEYISYKDSYEIPLRRESEGIIKIIAMVGALINFYTNENVITVVDELDAGIYEYLLGELLQVLYEGGKGQLLFTSHNLRPLEKLSKHNIYFTTCNKSKRYIKLVNVKQNNNLRDFYYRAVQLGGQSELLYEETNLEELSIALNKAGKYVQEY